MRRYEEQGWYPSTRGLGGQDGAHGKEGGGGWGMGAAPGSPQPAQGKAQ
jgi:hypothetical protein